MFYSLYRRAKSADDGISDLNAWVTTHDGVITEVSSPRLGAFHGKRIESLVAWCEERKVNIKVRVNRNEAHARSEVQ